ncbi:uncharacterized protein LOC129988358 [Argiope bruennichi]|uniref:uncharacterized protein LOC129988358 n=1 Tax=Argiope bruennichi TaxID=94029 RepID=UPI0024957D37|nr:uncharacterized protein LOC129988358 [Argiope bruennichi]
MYSNLNIQAEIGNVFKSSRIQHDLSAVVFSGRSGKRFAKTSYVNCRVKKLQVHEWSDNRCHQLNDLHINRIVEQTATPIKNKIIEQKIRRNQSGRNLPGDMGCSYCLSCPEKQKEDNNKNL